MKRFVETIKNIWGIEELKAKILTTLGLLLIYRIGSTVLLPGVDPSSLDTLQAETSEGLLGVLNAFTGGAFSRASVMALGIMPYISASIIIQLMGMAVPAVQKMQKDGESGRRKLNQITRYLTIVIAGVQAPAYLSTLNNQFQAELVAGMDGSTFVFLGWITLVTGTIFAMWLGERITDKGIGNGISLLIMVGIIATLPQAFFQEMTSQVSVGLGWVFFIIELFALFVITMFCVALTQAVRQIPVQYAKQVAAGGRMSGTPSARQYLPLKVNAAGVMPIIFAQAIMFIPMTILTSLGVEGAGASLMIDVFGDIEGFWYNFTFAVLIIVFTYFYTAIQVNTNNIADDLKRNGGFVPGIKPGAPTAEFLDTVLSRITFPGSLLLAVVAILPALAMVVGLNTQWAYFYGGTSLLITVGVILDTLQQVESYLLNRHYDGLMKSGKLRGRNTQSTFS
ncbi:MAG: preprotein translocase subunit SecY [Flavobacteriales bacterium]|jgi:preprotein translocase subunit SecY